MSSDNELVDNQKEDNSPRIEFHNEKEEDNSPRIEFHNEKEEDNSPRIESHNEKEDDISPRIEFHNEKEDDISPRIESHNEKEDDISPWIEFHNEKEDDISPQPEQANSTLQSNMESADPTMIPAIQILDIQQQIANTPTSTEPITLEHFQSLIKQIDQLIESESSLKSILMKFTEVLQGYRYVQTADQSQITDELREFGRKISIKVIRVTHNNIKSVEDINSCIESGLVYELIDIVRRKPQAEFTKELIELIWQISQQGSSEHTHSMYGMQAIQLLFQMVSSSGRYIVIHILKTITNIVKKGWKQVKVQDSNNNNISIHQSPLNISPSITHSQSKSSSFSSLPSELQNLLLVQHPYLNQLEQSGLIRNIILVVLRNKDIHAYEKKKTCEFLDSLYLEGIKLPTNLQRNIIADLYIQAISGKTGLRNQRIESRNHDNENEGEMNNAHALQALSFLAHNSENHQAILEKGFIYVALSFFQIEIDGGKVDSDIIVFSLQIFQMLFIYGTRITRGLIRKEIKDAMLDQLMNNEDCENEAKILKSTLADPVTMEKLIKIRRFVQNKEDLYIVQIIRSGLIQVLNGDYEKVINQQDLEDQTEGGPGILVVIGDILRYLQEDNVNSSQELITQTDFIENYLSIINSLPLSKIKSEYLQPLQFSFKDISTEQQQILYTKGFVQTMTKMLDCEDEQVRQTAVDIIGNIVIVGGQGVKEGETHPFHDQLESDGSVAKLIQVYYDEDKEDIHSYIERIIIFIFKAHPLPIEIENQIIQKVKKNKDFDELALLAESPVNHDTIIDFNIEKLFNIEKGERELFNLILLVHSFVSLGINENRLYISLATHQKMKLLTNAEYLNDFSKQNHWQLGLIGNIMAKAEETYQIIYKILHQDNNTNINEKEKEKEVRSENKDETNEQMEKQKQKEQEQEQEQGKEQFIIKETEQDKEQEQELKQEQDQEQEQEQEKEKKQIKDKLKVKKKVKEKEVQHEKEEIKSNDEKQIEDEQNEKEKHKKKEKAKDKQKNKTNKKENQKEKELDNKKEKEKDSQQQLENEKQQNNQKQQDKHQEKMKEQEKEQEKDNQKQKDKHKEKEQDKHKEKENGHEKEQEKEKIKHKTYEKEKDKKQDKAKEQNKEQKKEQEKELNKEQKKEQEKELNKEQKKEQKQQKEQENDKVNSSEQEKKENKDKEKERKDKQTEKDKQMDKENEAEKERKKQLEYEKQIEREKQIEKEIQLEKEKEIQDNNEKKNQKEQQIRKTQLYNTVLRMKKTKNLHIVEPKNLNIFSLVKSSSTFTVSNLFNVDDDWIVIDSKEIIEEKEIDKLNKKELRKWKP